MIKLLIGGSPCTYWSIAQKNNRETEPSGMGWELFKNYLIAKEKFKPDFFLYENNKSADEAIKRQIREELTVWDGTFLMEDTGARYIEINSALVSAQNRQRFYVHNCGEVGQPEDRGILLKDILESGQGWTEKSHAMTASYDGAVAWNTMERHQRTMIAEPVGITKDGKAFVLTANYSNGSGEKIGNYAAHTIEKACKTMVDEPVCVQEQVFGRKASENGDYDRRYEARSDGKSGSLTCANRQNAVAELVRIPEYSSEKSRPLNASYKNKGSGEGSIASECFPDNPNKQVFDYIAEPVNTTVDGKAKALRASADKDGIRNFVGNEKDKRTCVAESVNITADGKAHAVKAQYFKSGMANFVTNGEHIATGVAERVYYGAEAVEFDESGKPTEARSYADGKIYTVYEVKDGKITIKGKEYPIKLADGFYIIRKLTVTECCRLQTLPDDYCRTVSASQAYKGLGNGWTAEVIIHILSHALKDIPRDEKILVLSMYDGIGTGRYCLDKMGFTNVEYHAYEIDKYAMKIAMSNYPDIIQHGDAFAVRERRWAL